VPLHTVVAFALTEVALCVTPGPAVLCVISQALSRGTWAGLLASLGILAANTMYFALSATGIGALLASSWTIFSAIKWLGAAYLIWVGARMILARPQPPAQGDESAARSGRGAFSIGALTQGANPKALVFFTAILPQFIDPAGPVLRQILILGGISVVIEFAVLSGYVATCHAARGLVRQPRFSVGLQRLGGAFLVGAGARLAILRQL